jgi:hypothetical protein
VDHEAGQLIVPVMVARNGIGEGDASNCKSP